MKIRNGFVSNSSSSSFVLLTTVENHQKVLEIFQDDEKEILEKYIIQDRTKKLFGRNIISISGYDNNGNNWLNEIVDVYCENTNVQNDDYELNKKFDFIYYKYVNELKKNSEDTFYKKVNF